MLRPSQCSPSGIFETRPRVGFIPTRPQHDAGIRIDPPPSEPVANGTIPAATAAAEPPEDPPGVRSGFHGLRVIPVASLAVHGKIVSSGTFVTPIGIAPAARSRRTTSASAGAGGPYELEPRVVGSPASWRVALDRDRDARERAVGRRGVGGRERLLAASSSGTHSAAGRAPRSGCRHASTSSRGCDLPGANPRGERLGSGEDQISICTGHVRTIA